MEVSTASPDTVGVRDSKDVAGPELEFTGQAWTAFVQAVKQGQFEL